MTNGEGIEVFTRIMDDDCPRVVVSTRSPDTLLQGNRPQEEASPKRRAPGQLQKRPPQRIKYVAPDTEMEKEVAAIWQAQLGLTEVGIHDNFFDLGADSLNVIQVKGKVEDLLGMDIPIVTFYSYPTIHSLMEHLGNGQEKKTDGNRKAAVNKLGQRRKQVKANR